MEIALFLAEESGNEELSFRFLEAAETTFDELAAMPEVGALRDYGNQALKGLRMWRVSEFQSHLIFYRPIADGIDVVRVLHSKRDIEGLFEEEF